MNLQGAKQQYNRTLGGMGATELIIGILMVIFGAFTVASQSTAVRHYDRKTAKPLALETAYNTTNAFTYSSQGLWCGAAMIATGILGLAVKSYPIEEIYMANMVAASTTILAAVASTVLSVFAVNSVFFSEALIVAHAFIGLLSAISIAITITHDVYCHRGIQAGVHTKVRHNSDTSNGNFKSTTHI